MSVLFFIIVFLVNSVLFNRSLIPIGTAPHIIYNSTLSFRPNSSIIDQHTEARIAIILETGGEQINAVESVVNYDPAKIIVREVVMDRSFCDPELTIEKSINARLGKVVIACIVPGQGFSGERGVIGEMIIQPRKAGDFVLSFNPDTKILANDGLGTDVLRTAANSSYQVLELSDYSPGSGVLTSPRVYSETNPNSESWYATKEVKFFWNQQRKGDRFRYAFNDLPNYTPKLDPVSDHNFVSLPVISDGIYYFHLIVERDGLIAPTVHYKVKIDTTAPPKPIIKASGRKVKAGEVVRFEFYNQDEQPSYQNGFYVSLDEGTFLPVLAQLNIPFIESGRHTITLRVFDNAGNFSESFETIQVSE